VRKKKKKKRAGGKKLSLSIERREKDLGWERNIIVRERKKNERQFSRGVQMIGKERLAEYCILREKGRKKVLDLKLGERLRGKGKRVGTSVTLSTTKGRARKKNTCFRKKKKELLARKKEGWARKIRKRKMFQIGASR